MMNRRYLALLLFAFGLPAGDRAVAQSIPGGRAAPGLPDPGNPANFAVVVYNANDPLAEPLAKFYAEKRGIPPGRMVALKCPLTEEISREQYDREIAEPLRRAFDDHKWWDRSKDQPGRNPTSTVTLNRIRYLVLMRGIPLKIQQLTTPYPGDEAPRQPAAIQAANGAAVDSELAALGVFTRTISGFVPNPYFRGYSRILETSFPAMMLVGRLDGPSDAIVRRMIEDSLAVEQTGLWGRCYIDARGLGPDAGALYEGEAWLEKAAKECDLPVVIDRRPELFETGFPMREVALYFGWYGAGVAGPFTRPDFRFEPGAVAVHIHSFSASSIRDPDQGWAGPLLAKGAAATCGNVYEPYLHLTVHLDIFLDRLQAGFTLGESAYMALPGLSWMGTVMGDPLYRPFKVAQELAMTADLGMIDPEVDFKSVLPGAGEMRAFATIMHQRRSKPPNVTEAELIKYGRKYRSGRIYEGLGLFQFANGDAHTAARTFATARELYPNPEDALRVTLHEARALAKSGRGPQAIALLAATVTKHAASPAAESLRALQREIDPAPTTGTPTPAK